MSKELVRKVDNEYFNHVAHTNLHDAIFRIDEIYRKWSYGDLCWELNKHIDSEIKSIKYSLREIKEALPERDKDDTFLIDNNS